MECSLYKLYKDSFLKSELNVLLSMFAGQKLAIWNNCCWNSNNGASVYTWVWLWSRLNGSCVCVFLASVCVWQDCTSSAPHILRSSSRSSQGQLTSSAAGCHAFCSGKEKAVKGTHGISFSYLKKCIKNFKAALVRDNLHAVKHTYFKYVILWFFMCWQSFVAVTAIKF